MAIGGTSDPVVRLPILRRQQPHDHIRPQGDGSPGPLVGTRTVCPTLNR